MVNDLFTELLSSEMELINGGNPGLGGLYKPNEAPGLSKVVEKGTAPISATGDGHFYAIPGTKKWPDEYV